MLFRSIASTLKIAYQNGSPTYQWTRSPLTDDTDGAWRLGSSGDIGYSGCTGTGGSRPAFLISSSLTVEAEDTNPLEQYTVRELAEELFRRIGN